MIDLIAAATVGGFVGFFTCAVMTMGRAGDEQTALAEHARLADACLAKQARIDRLKEIASKQQSVKSGRIIDVLNGEGA